MISKMRRLASDSCHYSSRREAALIEGRAEAFVGSVQTLLESDTGLKVQPDLSVVTSPHKHSQVLSHVPYVKDMHSFFCTCSNTDLLLLLSDFAHSCICSYVFFTACSLSKHSFPSGDGEAD